MTGDTIINTTITTIINMTGTTIIMRAVNNFGKKTTETGTMFLFFTKPSSFWYSTQLPTICFSADATGPFFPNTVNSQCYQALLRTHDSASSFVHPCALTSSRHLPPMCTKESP